MDPLQDQLSQALAFNYRALAQAIAWGVAWALLSWGLYRLVLNRLLRLGYGMLRLAPEEHALRLGIPALILVLLIGARVCLSLLPGSPAAIQLWVGVAFWVFIVVIGIRILESVVIDAYLVEHRGMRLPRLLRDIVKALVYLTVFATLFQHLYGLNIGPLLTTSAVFTMIIGLAAQDTLGNLFAGLATSVDQPYQLENWITVDTNVRGRVIAITWRSTTIETWKGDKIIFPNNVLSRTRVLVHRWPRGYHKDEFFLRISTLVPSDLVRRVLFAAVRDIPYVEKTPSPSLEFGDFGDGFMTYILGAWVKDGTYPPVRTDVPIRLWYHLARHEIALGATVWGGAPEAPHPESTAVDTAAEIQAVTRSLKRVDFLAPLSDQELAELCGQLHLQRYATGEFLFHQGDEGSTFYVIMNGKVGIMVKSEQDTEMVKVATLEEGAYFGEMSLLTGAQRSATIQALTEVEVLAITREDFQFVLNTAPDIAETISHVIAERSLHTQRELAARQTDRADAKSDDAASAAHQAESRLLNSIRSFFKLT